MIACFLHPVSILTAVAGLVLLLAALHDLAFRTIPNWMPLLVAATGLALGAGENRLGGSLLGAIAVFVGTVLLWRRGLMGGGDVKLLAAAALLLPGRATLALLLCVAVSGGVLALCYLLLGWSLRRRHTGAHFRSRRPSRSFISRVLRAEQWRIMRGGPLPYAAAIAAGGLFVLYRV